MMRVLILCVAALLLMLTGCDKSDEQQSFAATYKGTFIRTDGSASGDPIMSNVTLHLSETAFTGSSDVPSYPAICSGNFTITQSKMVITNSCAFTANFDWTYIFGGEYNYEFKGNQLHIWHTYASGTTDVYKLTKAE